MAVKKKIIILLLFLLLLMSVGVLRVKPTYIESATALSDNREEESSDFPACRISETVSSLVLKLGLHIVVGSSRLDNHSQ